MIILTPGSDTVRASASFLFSAVVASSVSAAPVPYFAGTPDIYANSVSADGSTLVGACVDMQPCRWTSGGGAVPLGTLYPDKPAFSESAIDVSADGSTIVGGSVVLVGKSLHSKAFRWTSGGGMVDLEVAGNSAIAGGVSADGSMIVGHASGGGFIWTTGGGVEYLGLVPSAVSADGSTVVGQAGCEAARWTQGGGVEGLGLPPSTKCTYASAVSADGSIILGSTVGMFGEAGFRWTSLSGLEELDYYPVAISADGATGIGYQHSVPVYWDAINGPRPLDEFLTGLGIDLKGWTLDWVYDISADGLTIVGTGKNPSGIEGIQEGWVAVVPEPGEVLLLLTGAIVLGVRGRSRGRRIGSDSQA